MSKGRSVIKRMRDKGVGALLLLRKVHGESKKSDYGNVPLSHLPHWVGRMRRERQVILMERSRRRLTCMANARRNRMKRAKMFKAQGPEYAEKQGLLNKMTNWQLHQWSKASGKRAGGKKLTSAKAMRSYVKMPHWKAA